MKKQANKLIALWRVIDSNGSVAAIGNSETCCKVLGCSTQALKNCWNGVDGILKKQGYTVERCRVNAYKATHTDGSVLYGNVCSLMYETGTLNDQIYYLVKTGKTGENGWRFELLESESKEFMENLEKMEPGEKLFDYDNEPRRVVKDITTKDLNRILRVLYDANKRVQKKIQISHDQKFMEQYKKLIMDSYMRLTEIENEYHKRKASENG